MQPGNGYGIALLEVLDAGAERCDSARHLVPWHDRYVRLYRPMPIGRVQVRVANAARYDLHQQFPQTGIGNRNVVDRQRPSEP